LHPDVNPDVIAAETFLEIQKAYEVLNDEKLRAEYDQRLIIDSKEPVIVEVMYSRPYITRIDEPQILYTLLDFSAAEKYISQTINPLNIGLVIDRSTSMQGARMDTVKTAAIEMVRQLKNEDILSIIIFGDRAEVLLPATRRTDRSAIETQIRMVRAGGGTDLPGTVSRTC
jgi:curved DNA-binding protein CbpA